MSRYALLAGFVLTLCLSGCARVISIDYLPSNLSKGEGTVQIDPFVYRPAHEHLVRQREVEMAQEGIGTIFLSSEIGGVFAEALKRELTHSGYVVAPAQERIISGVIDRFRLDGTGEAGHKFELTVSSTITLHERTIYTHRCQSSETQGTIPIIMKEAMRDCIEQFMRGAQEAKAF